MNMHRKSRKWIERDKPQPLDEVLPVTLLLSKPEKKKAVEICTKVTQQISVPSPCAAGSVY